MTESINFPNKMKQKLRDGKIVMGIASKACSPTLVEITGYSGFDYLIIEMEHTPITLDDKTMHLIRAAELSGLTPLIRVRVNDPSLIHKSLDMGSQGIFVVHVESAEDAQNVVDAVKYPPLGKRGSGSGRYMGRHRYKLDRKTYLDYWNKESIVMFLVESKKGVNNLEDIVKVKGIDVIGIGQGDLSMELGNWVPRFQNPDCVEAVEKLLHLCNPRGIFVREKISDVDTALQWYKKGVRLFEWGNDTNIYGKAVKKIMTDTKNLRNM